MLFTVSKLISVWCCLLCALQLQQLPVHAQLESSQYLDVDGEEVTGRSRSSSVSTFRRLQLVCGKSLGHFQDLLDHTDLTGVYYNLKKELEGSNGVDHLFHNKIVPNLKGSVCQNLNVTCCKPAMEKSSEVMARDEYKFYYDQIFQSHSETCKSPGREFHSSTVKIIRQLVHEVELRVNRSLRIALPRDTFRDLSNFLASFSSVPDICRLPGLMDSQVQTLVDLMLTNMLQDDEEYEHVLEDPVVMKCARNISRSVVESYHKRIMTVMKNHLLDLSLLSEFFHQAHETVTIMRHYTFSRSCVTAITQMRYCPMCVGHGDFKPCLFKCINTLQGCFADLAEVQSDFIGLLSAARSLMNDVIKEIRPETFERSYFNQFVLMMEELEEREDYLKEALVFECGATLNNNQTDFNLTDYDDDETPVRKKRRASLIQTIQGSRSRPKVDPLIEQLDPEMLPTVMEFEIGCLERLAKKMKDVSEDICAGSRYEIAHKGNTQCWTGSVLGRYEHPKSGFMKKDQLRNPEYANIPMATAPRYSHLISALHTTTRRINSTIAFNKVCLDSDDEDCYTRNPFQNCRAIVKTPPLPEAESGSGSGSDSGINETATESGNEGVVTVRPTAPVSTTQQRVVVKTFDNKLRDGIAPSSAATMPTTQSQVPGMDNFDNTVPGAKKDKPAQTKKPVTVPSRVSTQNTKALAETTDPVNNEQATTVRMQGGVEATSLGNELSEAKTDAATDAATKTTTETSSESLVEQIPLINSSTVLSSSTLLLCLATVLTGMALRC